MGGKSSTSQSNESITRAETLSATSLGDSTQLSSGGDINFTQEFSPEVADAFSKLVDLAGGGLSLAREAGSFAIESVATRTQEATQPELSIINKTIPALLILATGTALYLVFKKGK